MMTQVADLTTRITCDGYHGESTIDIDPARIIRTYRTYSEVDAVWLTPQELRDNRPCGIDGCTCCDSFTILETRDGGFGDCLVMLR